MLDWLKQRSRRMLFALVVMLFAAALASSFPADIAFLFAIDLGTWVEAAVAVYLVASVARIRPIMAFVRARLFRARPRSARRRIAVTKRREPSNEDGPAPAFAVAA